jgi:hypothetical protein
MDAAMKKYLTRQNVAALVRTAVLCALALASVSFSPAFAATLSRSADVAGTLSAMWSMIEPFCAIEDWLSRQRRRGSVNRSITPLPQPPEGKYA